MKWNRQDGASFLTVVFDRSRGYDITDFLETDEKICLATKIRVTFDKDASCGLAVNFNGDLSPRFFPEWCLEKGYFVDVVEENNDVVVIAEDVQKYAFKHAILSPRLFDVRTIKPMNEFLCVHKKDGNTQSWTPLRDYLLSRNIAPPVLAASGH